MDSNRYNSLWKEGKILKIETAETVLKFTIKKELGRGSMGRVLLVTYENMDLALKIPLYKQTSIANYQSIPREAKLLLTLDIHPNIIGCYLIEIIEGYPSLFIEYADRGTLRDVIGKVKSIENIIELAIQVCSGMSHAHNYNKGLVHRDLKPENILLTSKEIINSSSKSLDFVAKVADFSLVKELFNEFSIINNDSFDSNNYLIGTPSYRSPEQWGYFDNVDQDTDIFSFGIILFEMITGHRPFETITSFASKPNAIEEHIKLLIRKWRKDCPEDLISIIINCLQFDPNDRWRNEKYKIRYHFFETVKDALIGVNVSHGHLQDQQLSYDERLNSLLYVFRGYSLSKINEFNLSIQCYDKAIKADPHNRDAYNNKGIDLEKLKRYEEALEHIKDSLKIDPFYANGHSNIGDILHEMGKYEEAIDYCNKAIHLDPNFKKAYNNKGRTLAALMRFDEALECLNKALSLDPNYVKALINKSSVLYKLKKYREAAIYCDKIISLDPNNVPGHINKSYVLHELDKNKEAIELMDKCIQLNRNDKDLYFHKGVLLINGLKFNEAIVCFDKVISLDVNYKEAYFHKGLALSVLEKYDEATECFNKAIGIDNNIADYHYGKGLALKKINKHDDAIICQDNAIAINPNYKEAIYEKGLNLMLQQKFYEAKSFFDKAISLDSKYVEAILHRGVVLLQLKVYDQALNDFNTLIELAPQYDKAFYNKGMALFALEEHKEALHSFDRAIELNAKYDKALYYKGLMLQLLKKDTDARGWYERSISASKDVQSLFTIVAKTLVEFEKYKEAIECLDMATERFKENTYFWNLKGYASERMGKNNQALKYYDKCLNLDPANEYARNAKVRIVNQQQK